jgi:hypothetical protein
VVENAKLQQPGPPRAGPRRRQRAAVPVRYAVTANADGDARCVRLRTAVAARRGVIKWALHFVVSGRDHDRDPSQHTLTDEDQALPSIELLCSLVGSEVQSRKPRFCAYAGSVQ